jgi:carnitine O-acetyltransferase
VEYDETGKISFDDIYTQPDPRAYFSTLRPLDYCIPQLAKPYFHTLCQQLRRQQRPAQHSGAVTVLDMGCSYGVNAALLKCDLTMDDLYRRYCGEPASAASRSALLARDREFVRLRDRLPFTRFVGLDASLPAVNYATQAGFLDDAVHADLEERTATERECGQFAGTDLIISTGCVGYVTDQTIFQVLDANDGRHPWMAHFVLRMFPFEPMMESLVGLGYETIGFDRAFRQRRFASPQEQEHILDTLSQAGMDPAGLEADGWLYAKLYVSKPAGGGR